MSELAENNVDKTEERADKNGNSMTATAAITANDEKSKQTNAEFLNVNKSPLSSTAQEECMPPAAKKLKSSSPTQHSLRKFRKIPIYIADYHNDVMKFLYKCFASRILPFEDNLLVHFDSHPDMVLSSTIPVSSIREREFMLNTLSIENWIMPSLFTGQFNRVVWLKQNFCQQIPNGIYKFKVGEVNDCLRVDCPLDYFILEGSYVETEQLQQSHNIELHVFDVTGDAPKADDFMPADINNNYYVLDIDLDYFSCKNPFISLYDKVNCLQRVGEIFTLTREENESNASYSARRSQFIQNLEAVFLSLEGQRTFDTTDFKQILNDKKLTQISDLVNELKSHYADAEINWDSIFDAGCTTDGNGLPHRISSELELKQAYDNFERLLKTLPNPPTVITIARSLTDDYCPNEQNDEVLENVQRILRNVFGDKLLEQPLLHDSDDESDLRSLYENAT